MHEQSIMGSVADVKVIPYHPEQTSFQRGVSRTLHLPRITMRQSAKVQEYFYEDLESLSQTAREVWLAEQCSAFEHEIRKFLPDRDAFVEDLYKKLKKITRRWSAWNHRAFGVVASRENIRELCVWEANNLPKHFNGGNKENGQSSSSESSEGNPLERFEAFCKHSEKILRIFRRDVYRPLCDFFSLDDEDSPTQELRRALERCLQKWETVMSSLPINEKLFSKPSELAIFKAALKNRTFEFDIVLRLVPDLLEKKIEALRLARRWRLIMKSNEIKRRGTYTIPQRVLGKRDTLRPPSVASTHDAVDRGYENVYIELQEAERRLKEISLNLEDSKRYCKRLEDQVEQYRSECESLKGQLQESRDQCNSLQGKLSISHQTDFFLNNEDITSSQEYNKILQRELEGAKMRYCTQKIKFMNARKRVENLNSQLLGSQQKQIKLEEDLKHSSERCTKLQDQLESTRKNVHTQGKMIDALQDQCYTLNQELDQSNIRKGELHKELEAARNKCESLESSLRDSKLREEDLERENTYLRELCRAQGCETPVKKASMFPDIRKSRSL